MHYRPLGRTGISVSEIGYGTWGIGGGMWVGATEDESVRALHRAIELGVTFIDTARGYSESERIVGSVVRQHPGAELYVATKVPPKNGIWPAPSGIDPMEAFPGQHIRESLDTSLRASGLDHFDVLQFHVWSDDWVGRGDWLETAEALKKDGKIRFFGAVRASAGGRRQRLLEGRFPCRSRRQSDRADRVARRERFTRHVDRSRPLHARGDLSGGRRHHVPRR